MHFTAHFIMPKETHTELYMSYFLYTSAIYYSMSIPNLINELTILLLHNNSMSLINEAAIKKMKKQTKKVQKKIVKDII